MAIFLAIKETGGFLIHLFFLQVLFELILFTICPEVMSEEVKQRAMVLMNMKNMQPISPHIDK